jgi:hypothetical protein
VNVIAMLCIIMTKNKKDQQKKYVRYEQTNRTVKNVVVNVAIQQMESAKKRSVSKEYYIEA